MAGSPSCSSTYSSATSPNAADSSSSHLQQEADAFSDDSGVDVKPQAADGRCHLRQAEDGKPQHRNKRKSSEPKRRKDVLLMKRFRWDTDEENFEDFEEEEEEEEEDNNEDDVFDVQRPGSGDSGCRLDPSPATTNRNLAPTTQATPTDKKSRRRQWRKPPIKEEEVVEKEDDNNNLSSAFRQSVIRKNETIPPCTDSSPPPSNESASSSPEAKPLPLGGAAKDCGVPEPQARGDRGRPARNYKSMSRQRRIEANARERTRVHTISAAFESLRRAVPAYAHNQKLSKLAILRIASAYIVALACLNNNEEAGHHRASSSMAECVERCTRTIQAEGRSRRRTSKE